jgi:hypothetical protein
MKILYQQFLKSSLPFYGPRKQKFFPGLNRSRPDIDFQIFLPIFALNELFGTSYGRGDWFGLFCRLYSVEAHTVWPREY